MQSFTPFLVKIKAALAIGLGLLALVGTASFWAIDRLIDTAQARVQTEEFMVEIERAASSVKVVESALRQYLLSGNSADLVQIAVVSSTVVEAFGRLRTTGLLPEQAVLDNIMLQRRTLSEQAIAARQSQGVQAAAEVVNNNLSKELRRRTEEIFENARQREYKAWQASQLEAQNSAGWAKIFIVATGLLFAALLAWAFYVTNHYEAARKRIQAQLQDSEAMSRSITESMAQGIITTTAENIVLQATAAALALFGYEKGDLIGRNVTDLVPQRLRAVYHATTAQLRLAGRDFRLPDREIRSLRKDGSEFTASVSFSNVKVGEQQLFTALIHDITESQRMTKALRASETQLRQITDAVPALIAYVDKKQRFGFHNRAYEAMLGLEFEQVRNQHLSDVLGLKIYAEVKPWVELALAGHAVQYEREHVSAQGERKSFAVQYFPRHGEGTDSEKIIGFYALGTDITEARRIDRMKTEFISTVSHELRTPLTSIRGSLGLLAGGVAGEMPAKFKSLVDIAKNNCERLIRLINDMLDSEKIESGQMRFDLQPTQLHGLADQAIAGLAGFAQQHGVTLHLQALAADSFTALVDADRTLQVLTNLLSNAIKFSPTGGAVTVALKTRLAQGKAPAMVRVEVADQGRGIDSEFKSRIFQKFSQADASDTRQKGGTGLGLNISRALIEKMNGHIGFDSQPGVGCCFYFEVPSAAMCVTPRILVCERDPEVAKLVAMLLEKPVDVQLAIAKMVQTARPVQPSIQPRVLHVEDDPDMQHIAAEIGRGVADFVSASNLAQAVLQLQTQHFDLVLLDLGLGSESGWSLFETIDTLQPRPAVIVFSASEVAPENGTQAQALLVKAQTSNSELLCTIEQVLRQSRGQG